MQKANSGNIYIYDKQKNHLLGEEFFNFEMFKTFDTDNIYQLMRYSHELFPDIMIFELDDEQARISAEQFLRNEKNIVNYPIIVVQKQLQTFMVNQQIGHYFTLPMQQYKLRETIECYCVGNKQHQLMLLSTFDNQYDTLHESIDYNHYHYFDVHSIGAAQAYLNKNHPEIICIEYTQEFVALAHTLPHKRIFYVDRQQDITEIGKFLH